MSELEQPKDTEDEIDINTFVKTFNANRGDLIDARTEGYTLGQNVVAILKKITLGLAEWEYKILASAACVNSILCNILPIIELKGEAGSGKSQLLIAISEIANANLLSGQSTGASLKNYINKIRWADPETKSKEKPCILLIDNLNEDSFKKEEYLASFLNGYNRKTDRTFISNGKGENIEFKTFALKIYTTIWDNNSTELKRRTISIKTKKTKELSSTLDVEDICWDAIAQDRKQFWESPASWTAFVEHKTAITKFHKSGSKEWWVLLRDLLATGIAIGVWNDTTSAIAETAEWLAKSQVTRLNLLEAVILKALEAEIGFERTKWLSLSETVRIHIAPRAVKNAIDVAVSDGLINKPKLVDVQTALQKLGFVPGKKNEIWGYKYKGREES